MKTRRSRYSLRANLYVGSHLNMETNRAARISSSPLFLLAWFFKSQNQFYLFYMVYLVCTYVYTHIMYLQPSLRALAIRQDLICMREQVENSQPFYPSSVHCKRCFTQTLVTATYLQVQVYRGSSQNRTKMEKHPCYPKSPLCEVSATQVALHYFDTIPKFQHF